MNFRVKRVQVITHDVTDVKTADMAIAVVKDMYGGGQTRGVTYEAEPMLPEGWAVTGPAEYTRNAGVFLLVVDNKADTVTDAIWTGRIVIFNGRGEKLTLLNGEKSYLNAMNAIYYVDGKFQELLNLSQNTKG